MAQKVSLDDVDLALTRKRMYYGVDVEFDDEIDTSQCEEFFGKRCPKNIHVTCLRKAHRDRADPRFEPLRHMEQDLKLNKVFLSMMAFGGLGAFTERDQRLKGALIGGIIGLLIGLTSK